MGRPRKSVVIDLRVFTAVMDEHRAHAGKKPIEQICYDISKIGSKKLSLSPDSIYDIYRRVAPQLLPLFLSAGELPPGPRGNRYKRVRDEKDRTFEVGRYRVRRVR